MPKRIPRPIPYRLKDHGSFEEEWGIHKKSSEWWYATGVLNDEQGKLYSYQVTLLRIRAACLRPYILMLALTDFETGRHRYRQRITLSTKRIEITQTRVRFGEEALVEKRPEGMRVVVRQPDFSLDLELRYGKGAVWHCDGGALTMGVDQPNQTTLYYSYPNMPTRGGITLDGARLRVSGKTWFDKQGGPYALLRPETHWEWFSLRFFDDEEMMLFSFPQDDYRDGTYIRRDGGYERLNDYELGATSFITVEGGLKYADGWSLCVPNRKQERYTIRPLLDGQMNLGYYELLAGVYAESGELVGHCFAELLPGTRNKTFSVQLFQRAER